MRKTYDITLEINGAERTISITPDYRTIGEIESHEFHRNGDGAIGLIWDRFRRRAQRLSDYVAVIHGGLRGAGIRDVTAEEIAEAIVEEGPISFAVVCASILTEALTGGRKSKSKKKAAAKKKKARGKK